MSPTHGRTNLIVVSKCGKWADSYSHDGSRTHNRDLASVWRERHAMMVSAGADVTLIELTEEEPMWKQHYDPSWLAKAGQKDDK